MTEPNEEQRAKLAAFFFSRARGERTTSLAFEHILADLQSIPGTNDFIRMVESARKDELRHSGICMDFVRLYSDGDVPELTVRGERPVSFPDASEKDQRILRLVFAGCFCESIAVRWLLDAHEKCTDPQSRKYNKDHLRDEVKHSQLGWKFIASHLLSLRDRQMISSHLPLMIEWSRRVWLDETAEEDPSLAIYGCPPPQSSARAVETALSEVIVPGFEINGFKVAFS